MAKTRPIGGSTNKGYASAKPQRTGKSTWFGGQDTYAGSDNWFGGNGFGGGSTAPSNKLKDYKGGPQLKDIDREKTDEERVALKLKQGIAPTAKNMGSLGVQYRADEATAKEAGVQTASTKRAMKIIDTRAADDYKYNVTNPARRMQAAKAAAVRKKKQESGAMGRAWNKYSSRPMRTISSGGSGTAPKSRGGFQSSSKAPKTTPYMAGGEGVDEARRRKEKARVAGYGLFPT